MSIREGELLYMAPSGVAKERLHPAEIFTLDLKGNIVEYPLVHGHKLSQCAPLFLAAYQLRSAGAVLHSHSIDAKAATLLNPNATEFRMSRMEMIKGIGGVGSSDKIVIPIIENTSQECDLTESLRNAIAKYPETNAVLVRRHGVYIWGKDWFEAKSNAESYDYLFKAAFRLKELGLSGED